jgi:arsenical pump membrane protein
VTAVSSGEALVVGAAAVAVATGVETVSGCLHTLRAIGPTVGFLAAILVFGYLCADAGVFRYLGARIAHAAGRDDTRLLALVVALAAAVTAVLTLDATVVLLTPVLADTVRRLRVAPQPPLLSCVRLANSGSLLLPVSNLTNLLAFSATRISFGRFAALMWLPWLVVIGAEWLGVRVAFRGQLHRPVASLPLAGPAPRYALAVLGLTVAGFVAATTEHAAPAWAALAGCLALLAPNWRTARPGRVIRAAAPGFCVFVLALAVLVDGLTRHGLDSALRHLLPHGTGWSALLLVALLSAVLANLVNNLPATLALVPLVAATPAWTLAMLIGVNVGPNATYPGSLATLLWRRQVPAALRPTTREFHRYGAVTVPVLLVLASSALWLSVRLFGT